MAVHRKGKGCGCSCRMRTQRHTRVHHRRIVPSALALATSAAFSMTELWDFKWKLAGASICPLQTCDIQMQPSGSSMTVTGHAGQTHFCPSELAFATKIAISVAELRILAGSLLALQPAHCTPLRCKDSHCCSIKPHLSILCPSVRSKH